MRDNASVHRARVWSWALYDWANSAFATTVVAGFFPVFFQKYWSQGVDPAQTTALLGTTLSISGLALAMSAPVLGAVSDLSANKKSLLFGFMLLGVLGTCSLSTIPQGGFQIAAIVYGISFYCFTAANVIYDSLLPSVSKDNEDHVSSFGFAMGYLGGGFLLIINVLMHSKPYLFGLEDPIAAVKAAFVTVGIWWFVFSIPLLMFVPEPTLKAEKIAWTRAVRLSFSQILSTFRKIRVQRNLFLFIVAYWLYIDGVYTVIAMAVNHGAALNISSSSLVGALLFTQFVGAPSTVVAGMISKKFGAKKVILASLIVYAGVVLYATQLTNEIEFFVLAGTIGLVQGAVQALSRSMFSRMIPKDSAGEYFGFYNLIGKFASVVGPAIVAIGALVTGSSRYSILGLLILFVSGAALLFFVREEPAVS